jgi:hypothetical protein
MRTRELVNGKVKEERKSLYMQRTIKGRRDIRKEYKGSGGWKGCCRGGEG